MSRPYDFPKVELHCHLDGCARLHTVADLAKKRGIFLPTYNPEDLKKHISVQKRGTLKEFLEKFHVMLPALAGDASAITRLTKEAIEDRSEDGVVYLELRYSPHLLANCDVEHVFFQNEKGRLRPKDVVEVVNKAVKESEEQFNIKVRTILCDIAEYPSWGLQTAQLCHEYANHGVVGMDVANMWGAGNFLAEGVKAFQYCNDNGIRRTAHAGEVGPASQVKQAIEQMGVDRIGHGYHAVDDEEVYSLCKERGTHFEVCPLSSYFTSSVPEDWHEHPAKRFFADDINFSLNTDDPGVQMTSLHDEYDIATKYWGFSEKDLQKLNLNAAQSSFLNVVERQELVQELKNAYKSPKDID